MGDTDYHSSAMVHLREAMEDHFADADDVYVGMNLIVYFKQGDSSQRRDPDVLVARGVRGKHMRRSFRVWEEKTLPNTLVEIVSLNSVESDLGEKLADYERYRIKEYILFDPEGKYMSPRLRGFRLVRGRFVEMTPEDDGSLISTELNVRLVPEGTMLRVIDLKTGKPVLTRAERAEQALDLARMERRKARTARRREAEERGRVEEVKLQAEQQRQKADAAAQHLEEERRRNAALVAEVKRLQDLLREQGLQQP
jgi:hypothetical protein